MFRVVTRATASLAPDNHCPFWSPFYEQPEKPRNPPQIPACRPSHACQFRAGRDRRANPGNGRGAGPQYLYVCGSYMRGRMVDRASYVPPFQVGEVLSGGAIGQVVASNNNKDFKAGDYVSNFNGWREWFVSSSGGLQKLDHTIAPIQSYLGALGMP